MEIRIENPRVLLVDDEPALVGLYEAALEETCDVVAATDGEEALALVDESVDVVLLDRRMPGTSGDEVLSALRQRGYEMPVGIVSGIQPDTDILGLPLDAYLIKPVEPEQLRETAELLAVRTEFDERCRELFRLVAKKTALEAAGAVDRDSSRRFQRLVDRIETLRNALGIDRRVVSRPDRIAESEERLAGVRNACLPS